MCGRARQRSEAGHGGTNLTASLFCFVYAELCVWMWKQEKKTTVEFFCVWENMGAGVYILVYLCIYAYLCIFACQHRNVVKNKKWQAAHSVQQYFCTELHVNELLCAFVCRMQFGGLGQLCDGVLGGDDFIQTKELRVWPGYDYLGWSREALGQGSVDIEFHFEKPRVFHKMQVGSESRVCKIVLFVKEQRGSCTILLSCRNVRQHQAACKPELKTDICGFCLQRDYLLKYAGMCIMRQWSQRSWRICRTSCSTQSHLILYVIWWL